MKRSVQSLAGAFVLGAFTLFGSAALAQVTTTETTTSSGDGTVTEFSPTSDSIVLRSDSGPVTYGYTKRTTVVDESGSPVDVSVVRSGVPVRVFYTRDGDRMVASRIVVVRHQPAVEHREVIEEHHPAAVEHEVTEERHPVIEKKESTTTTTTTTGSHRREHEDD